MDDEWLDDLLTQTGTEWSKTLKLHTLNHLLNLHRVMDVVALQIRVHEADLDAVLVEEGSGEGDAGEDHLQIINTLSIFLDWC